MKKTLPTLCCLAALTLVGAPRLLRAQTTEEIPPAPVPAPAKPYAIDVTDAEKVDIVEAVQGYIYGKAPAKDSLKIFDSEKGEVVVLKYKQMKLGPEGCAVRGKGGYYAVCADFVSKDNDQYTLIFVVKRQTERQERLSGSSIVKTKPLGQMTVRDVIIGSVNGVERYTWKQDAEGRWRAEPANVAGGNLPVEEPESELP